MNSKLQQIGLSSSGAIRKTLSVRTNFISRCIVRTLREDQPLRLPLNLLCYHFNHSEPTYKFQCIKLQHVIATCNQLNMNALN